VKHSAILAFALSGVALVTTGTFAQDKGGQAADAGQGAAAGNGLANMQQMFLQQFDVNKDGVLSDQEKMMAQEAMRRQGWNLGVAPGGFAGADQFARAFDRDGDGKLSPMEAVAAQAAFNRMRGNGMRGNGMSGGIRGGGGAPARGVMPQPLVPVGPAAKGGGKVSPLVKRFDKDGDGKLSKEEKADAQAELKMGKGKEEKTAKKVK
jgi:hypothetical protein